MVISNPENEIVEVTSTKHHVNITLANGVVLSVSSNVEFFNFHFSGTEVPLHCHPGHPRDVKDLPNTFNVFFKPMKNG